jgi:hypothetical protein
MYTRNKTMRETQYRVYVLLLQIYDTTCRDRISSCILTVNKDFWGGFHFLVSGRMSKSLTGDQKIERTHKQKDVKE